jgi:ubiquinol-cytochrome c reductase cytochrome b subunit
VVASPVRRVNRALDDRLGSQSFLRNALDHIFPDNWSFMLGEVAFYCFIILVVSGVYLTFYFDPSDTEVVYHGSYAPLHGQTVSLAYQSAVRLSLDVKGGLVFRQVHHWAADLFIAAIACHLARIFFTGAFRKPRDINWLVGVTLLLFSIFNGYTGYSMPEDLLSGSGLRIAFSLAEGIPVVGPWLAYLLFGGQYPSVALDHRLYVSHVFIVPVILFGLLGLHLALIWRQKHAQFPGPGRTQRKLVGSQLWPTYAARSIGLFAAVVGVLTLLGGLAEINPIWLYGPWKPDTTSAGSEPDWYVGWLIGALRLFPGWRIHLPGGYTVSETFWPGVFLPLATFALLYAWPWLERWWTNDLMSHNLLDRPRDRPGRTAIGAGFFTFYFFLLVAGAQDQLAKWMRTPQPPLTLALRGLTLLAPFAVAAITYRLCRDLARGGPPAVGEPPEGSEHSATPPTERYLPVPDLRAGPEHDGRLVPPRHRLRTVGLGAASLGAAALAVRRRRSARKPTRRGRR